MAKEIKVNSSQVSIVGLLGVAFVILKLCKVINWPWLWVTAPFWGIPAAALAIMAICLVVAGLLFTVGCVGEGVTSCAKSRRKRKELEAALVNATSL